jgi:hypothetical protein
LSTRKIFVTRISSGLGAYLAELLSLSLSLSWGAEVILAAGREGALAAVA